MHHLLLALPFSVHGAVFGLVVGGSMMGVGLMVVLLNRVLKKAQADQIAQLWRQCDRREEPASVAGSPNAPGRRAAPGP